MWIETATEGEYLNPDMIERVTVEERDRGALDALDERRGR